ncbi:MAG TPA: type 4 pilus major pilin [Gammaproteobacteria bacterium]
MKLMICGLGVLAAALTFVPGANVEAKGVGEGLEFFHTLYEAKELLGIINTSAGLDDFTIITVQLGSEDAMIQSAMTTDLAIKMGVFPSNLVQDGKVYNRWGGSIILGHTPEGRMYLYTSKLPQEVCKGVIARDMAAFPYIGVNWTAMTDVKSAMNTCADGENAVIFSFDRNYPSELLTGPMP